MIIAFFRYVCVHAHACVQMVINEVVVAVCCGKCIHSGTFVPG